MFLKNSESTNVDWLISGWDRETLAHETKEVLESKRILNHRTNQLGNFPFSVHLACLSDLMLSCYSILLGKFIKTLKMFQIKFLPDNLSLLFHLFCLGFLWWVSNIYELSMKEVRNCFLEKK